MSKHFLYRHIRTDTNQPFYIGIGTKANNHGNTIKQEFLRAYRPFDRTKLWKNYAANGYEVEILYEADDHSEILQKEIEFIKLYGKLCNQIVRY